MSSYLQSADDLLHLGSAEVQEALNQIPVDKSRGLLRLTLCVERSPGAAESRKINTRLLCCLKITLYAQYHIFHLRHSQQIFCILRRKSNKNSAVQKSCQSIRIQNWSLSYNSTRCDRKRVLIQQDTKRLQFGLNSPNYFFFLGFNA